MDQFTVSPTDTDGMLNGIGLDKTAPFANESSAKNALNCLGQTYFYTI